MGMAQIDFLHLREQHMLQYVAFVRLNTLKGTAIILMVVILAFKRYQIQVLTPKRYDEFLFPPPGISNVFAVGITATSHLITVK